MLIEKLRYQLTGHRAHRFGPSGESAEQLQPALEASEVAVAAIMDWLGLPEDDGAAEPERPRRRPLPDHIPRMTVEIAPGEDACAGCGGRLRRLGGGRRAVVRHWSEDNGERGAGAWRGGISRQSGGLSARRAAASS